MASRSKRAGGSVERARGARPRERSRAPAARKEGDEKRHAALVQKLARQPKDPGWILTDFGCSDCRGVLRVSEIGKHGWLTFKCRVGHTFSLDTLMLLKDDQLEESLWSTIEVLEEIVQLYEGLSELGWIGAARPSASTVTARLETARRHLGMLRQIVQSEGPTPRQRPREGANDRR
jgi:hypothetical protein